MCVFLFLKRMESLHLTVTHTEICWADTCWTAGRKHSHRLEMAARAPAADWSLLVMQWIREHSLSTVNPPILAFNPAAGSRTLTSRAQYFLNWSVQMFGLDCMQSCVHVSKIQFWHCHLSVDWWRKKIMDRFFFKNRKSSQVVVKQLFHISW